MKTVKTYRDTTLSGVPLIIKLQTVLGLYAYIKVYPTIEAAANGTSDIYTTNLEALTDATLSKECIIGFIVTGGIAYFTKAYRTISSEVEAYSGIIPTLQIHLNGYLSGIPRIAEIYVNSTPYYYKVYPTMISSSIADAISKSEASIDSAELLYISIIGGAIENNFPVMTASGELKTSVYNHSTYALSGHNHSGVYDPIGTGHTEATNHITSHESTYNHTNYNTAYNDRLKWDGGSTGLTAETGRTSLGLGSAATQDSSAFANASHNHDDRYYTETETTNLLLTKSDASHNHSGVYDPLGTGHTEATAHVSSHESTYNHTNYNTAYSHVSDKNNPHSVTKTQLGLSNVENTALSTWRGTDNITTLGKLNLTKQIIAQSGTAYAITLNNTTISSNNNDYLTELFVYPTYIVNHTGVVLSGISLPNATISGGTTPTFKQAITIDAQTGATNNWSIVAYGNSYFGGYVSADSFIDRTPAFTDDGIDAIRKIKSKKGKIDHSTLPDFARKTIQSSNSAEGIVEEAEGRGLGEMISILVKAVQQLTDRVEDLEKQIGGK